MKITFCSFNEHKEDVIELMKKHHPEFETSMAKCIYSCGECANKPIARINGQLLVGEDSQELLRKILEFSKI